jgi:genome maintenance exonuclease 1|tara:strand:+ start:186 stop:863 length:678 start_codon:yes stop_codon:yes gene_type:complete
MKRVFKHEELDIGYDDLVADTRETGRVYVAPDGSRYPSVTTVLGILSEDSIREWRQRVGEEEANKVSHRASNRGTAVHSIIEKYLRNEDTSDNLPHIKQSLANLRPILDKSIGKIFGLETALYSRHLGMAGRCDCIAEWNGVPSIIDFKTSKRVKKKENIASYFAQASAYAIMFEERTGLAIPNTVIVMDVDDNHPLIFEEHRDNFVELLLSTKKEYDRRKLFSH